MFTLQGYSRVGAALAFLKRYEEAATAYQNGLKLDPNNDQLVNGLKEVENEISGPGSRCKLKHFYIIFHNIYPNQILL